MSEQGRPPEERRTNTNSVHGIEPLPGEAGIPSVATPPQVTVPRKLAIAVVVMVLTVTAASGIAIARALSGQKESDEPSKRSGERPAAAGMTHTLDLGVLPTAASAPSKRLVPEIIPTAEERSAPVPVRAAPAPPAPEDAPAMLLSSRPAATPSASSAGRSSAPATGAGRTDDPTDTRRHLEAYQRQLMGSLEALSKGAPAPAPNGASQHRPAAGASTGLFGGELPSSVVRRVRAGQLASRSLTLPKGSAFTCALTTRVISATSGLVGCMVQRDVFSDDKRVLLIERGSHLDGEYRIASLRPGSVRIPVVWTRVRTPLGIVVDIDSPGTGPLGESGVEGDLDNRWPERIGAAMLLSLIDDSVRLAVSNQSGPSQGNTLVLSSTATDAGRLAEKVLDSTINIPPLIHRNQGGIVGIVVAHDLDFSSVYELVPR